MNEPRIALSAMVQGVSNLVFKELPFYFDYWGLKTLLSHLLTS